MTRLMRASDDEKSSQRKYFSLFQLYFQAIVIRCFHFFLIFLAICVILALSAGRDSVDDERNIYLMNQGFHTLTAVNVHADVSLL